MERFGTYEIEEPLGAGGMGEVYRAHDPNLKRDVAIKVLPAELASDPDRLARLEREAHLLAALNHPNVATIHGLEETRADDGTSSRFLVLELVEGETLEEHLRSGSLEVEEALELAVQIARGLEAAHAQGIVHRDLKPGNIKITPDGLVKVLDFGLAKPSEAVDAEADEDGLTRSPTVTVAGTETGVILGTAAYMSPEQARGRAVDQRTDVWSFGCVLYEMLTGRRPFQGEDVSETLASILKEAPDWEGLPEDTPLMARALLRRCLRKDPDQRVHHVADARIELEEVLQEPADLWEAEQQRPSPVPFRWLVALVAVSAVLFVASFVSWRMGRPLTPRVMIEPEPVHFSVDAPDGSFLPDRGGVALSPDGTRLAFVARDPGAERMLYLHAFETGQSVPLPETEGAEGPFFSPTGEWIGFFDGTELKKAPVSGGAVPTSVTTLPGSGHHGATWMLDGTIFFSVQGSELMRVSDDGGTWEEMVFGGPAALAYGPDARHGEQTVLTSRGRYSDHSADNASVAVLFPRSGEEKLLFNGGFWPRYAGSEHIVYARDGALWSVGFDPQRRETIGAAKAVIEGVQMNQRNGRAHFDVSDNGTLAYVPGDRLPDAELVFMSREGVPTPVSDEKQGYYEVSYSPDGTRLVFNSGWVAHNLWVHDLARGTADRLVTADAHSITWSPKGVLFFRWQTSPGPENIFQIAPSPGEPHRITSSANDQRPNSVSPDGATLVFQELRADTGWDLRVLSLQDGAGPAELLVTPANETNASLSPNGKWIAYQSDDSGGSEVYVAPFSDADPEAQRWRVSTRGGTYPRWSHDGSEIFFWSEDALWAAAVHTDGPRIEPGPPERLFDVKLSYSGGWDVAPNGEGFVIVREPEVQPATEISVVLNWLEELERLVPGAQ